MMMMSVSSSPSPLTRSSLEEMLDSLRRRDDIEKPKDQPPALPSRPRATTKARLPSAKRSLLKNCDVSDIMSQCSEYISENSEKPKGTKGSIFGWKKLKEDEPCESPYVMASKEKECEQRSGIKGGSGSSPRFKESDWNDSVGYFIKKKLQVWCQPQNGQWKLGLIQSTSGEKASVLLLDGSAVTVPTGELLPANPVILEGVDDLVQLVYLNEPSVLHNLQHRYSRDTIYSKAGPVLIAINPFKKIQLYGNDFVTAYRQQLLDSPHVYAIADTAYNKMMREDINQSIIISGQSGAGKTETAKIALQYLAALSGGSYGIECEILKTSFILEAFGNAKTSWNDNSSRFGQLIEIHFSAAGKIRGAKIQTLLLDESRVVKLAHGERSYHIFYQLCAGAPSNLKDRLNLKSASEYKYLSQSNCLVIDGVDDALKYQELMEAFDTLRICKEDQEHALEMLAAVLWLGNISFQLIDNENHVEALADEAVVTAASLVGCSAQDLVLALSGHRFQAGKYSVAKKLTLQQAVDTRDALAKLIYARLFDWLIGEINKSLEIGKQFTGRCIIILDIYGFESFKRNSFEQFCINYANERLQQHFIRHFFKLPQEEYESDGIDWTKVEFEDNQECLNLIEKKPVGLISLLDEESSCPGAAGLTFANKLKQHLSANPFFKGEKSGTFGIRHYFGEVVYDTNGFLEKNTCMMESDIIQLLSSCSSRLSQLFASKSLNQFSSNLGAVNSQKESVGIKFKGQLFKLMQQLEKTTPQFILCIKPNSKQLPGIYEKNLVLEQLRSCGVLEIVRISRSGYPTRMTHQDFVSRFGLLLWGKYEYQEPLSISIAILKQFHILPYMYQAGYTRLYFRTGQIGALENMRKSVLHGTLEMQKFFRGHQARLYFKELKRRAITLQSFVRGENSRRQYGVLIELRDQIAYKTLEEQLKAVVRVQSVIRGWLARRNFSCLQNMKNLNPHNLYCKQRTECEISEVKDSSQEQVEALPSEVEELQRRVLKAEATLEQKEAENAALRKQVQQFDVRFLEYEAKMKSVEAMWQKQMASLQASLAIAKKSLAADNTAGHLGSPSPCCYDSEDATSVGTSERNTPARYANSEFGAGRRTSGGNRLDHLLKEFEQKKQNFEDEAKAIVEVRPVRSPSTCPDELRRLKHKFEAWKKEYKISLREMKVKLNKEAEKGKKRWWGMRRH